MSGEGSGASPLRVARLFVYPVKSCAGIEVDEAEIAAGGFAHDRRWMITDPSGTFVTQRELPELSQLKLDFVEGTPEPAYRISWKADALRFPRFLQETEGKPLSVRVWGDQVEARELPELSEWLSGALGRPLRGVFVPEQSLRQVNPARALPGDRVSFADGYPFLLVSEESLAELNRRLEARGEAAFDVRRFRPNIVVSGCSAPHEEDQWREVRIGGATFRQTKPCDRCSVTTVDPDSGRRGKEPLRTLSEYRRWDGKVWFAINLVHAREHIGRTLRRGDPIEVLGRVEG